MAIFNSYVSLLEAKPFFARVPSYSKKYPNEMVV